MRNILIAEFSAIGRVIREWGDSESSFLWNFKIRSYMQT